MLLTVPLYHKYAIFSSMNQKVLTDFHNKLSDYFMNQYSFHYLTSIQKAARSNIYGQPFSLFYQFFFSLELSC